MSTNGKGLAPFFFTELDESLRPRGSRDPVGTELVWAAAGRRLVGNLTTVTAHLDNFVFALLGFHVCRDDTGRADWKAFQRFEQLTGHARCRMERADGVLGRRRIESQLNMEEVQIGERRAAAILENQRQAGMWGLYSNALMASDLLESDRRLSETGEALALRFLDGKPVPWMERTAALQRWGGADLEAVIKWTKRILSHERERKTLAEQLLVGGASAPELQAELFSYGLHFLESNPPDKRPRAVLDYLAGHAGDEMRQLAVKLKQLDDALILADMMFGALLGCHGMARSDIGRRLEVLLSWPARQQLRVPNIAGLNQGETGARVQACREFCEKVATGDLTAAVDRLLLHHASVMEQRGGVAWCAWEGENLKVISSDTASPLPAAAELQNDFAAWSATKTKGYFLGSFLGVLVQSGLTDALDTRVAA